MLIIFLCIDIMQKSIIKGLISVGSVNLIKEVK